MNRMPAIATATSLPPAPPGGESPPSLEALLTLGLYAGIALFLISTLLFLAWFLGHKTRSPLKNEPYESGVAPSGEARLLEPVPFYLVAIFFIVFDVEAIFIVSWAVAWDLLGWAGFAQICFFIIILFLGLIYLWKMGGLDWGPSAQRRSRRRG
jgi:NADH-quinone oxidoreductase subunit A